MGVYVTAVSFEQMAETGENIQETETEKAKKTGEVEETEEVEVEETATK